MHTKNYRSYDIDPMIYQELKWFCFRYDRMKAERSVYYAPRAMNYDGIRCENCSGNSGESNALKAMKLSEDIDLIDKALELTADERSGASSKRMLLRRICLMKGLEMYRWDDSNSTRSGENFSTF